MRRNNMNNNPMQGRGGPLMTDHLQDLELELELLKRKRQLIQRQQTNMLYNRPGGSIGGGLGGSLLNDARYNQPSESYNDRFNEPQHLNFSHLYNENSWNNQSHGLKRQAQSDWSSSSGNNMGGQKRSRPNPFVQPFQNNTQQSFQQPGFMPQPLLSTPKPKPLMDFSIPRNRPVNRPIMKQNQGPKPLTHHPNFKHNKPANRPSGPGNRPTGPANRPTGPANRPNGPANRPTWPNNRPTGLPGNRPVATGFIAKKNTTPKKPVENNSPPNNSASNSRVFTGSGRPNNKINGRLELALGMIVKEIKAIFENKPEYKSLFTPAARLLKQGVRERLHSAMLGKVVNKASDIIAEYRQKFPLDTDKEIVELAVLEQKKNDKKLEIAITLLEEGDPEQYFKKNMNMLLQQKFDEMLGKLTKMITDENESTMAEILSHLPELKKEPQNTTASTDTSKVAEKEPVKEETSASSETAPEKVTDESQKADEPAKADGETQPTENGALPDIYEKESMYDKWLSLYIQRRLPALVNRHKSNILKVFDLDKMFANTKAAIIINANNKAEALKAGEKNLNEQGKDDPELPRNLPYFAKLLAVPSMPKRKTMQVFLNQFQPKTIKRHKKNYNLLFIGFDSKENYDKILAADQTTLANATLSIMGNVTKATAEQNDDIDQVLTPQLDDQITDLLTSIRKADEEAKASGDNSATDIDLTLDESQEVNENPKETVNTDNAETDETENAKVTEELNEAATANETEIPEMIEENKNGDAANGNENDDIQIIEANENNVVTIEDDEVAPLKSEEVKNPCTPAKGRAPATPRSITTRRSSRLQN